MYDANRRSPFVEQSAPASVLDLPIHSLFEAQALRTPSKVAVTSRHRWISYQSLDARANHLAHVLKARGVTCGSRVAILLRHSIETVVAVLGVLKSGAAYVPLDPVHPAARFRYMLDDSAARLVITTSDLASRIAGRATLKMDTERARLDEADDAPPGVAVVPEDLAYVVYTSGSTGVPKGVAIQHRALVNYIAWANEAYFNNEPYDFALHSSLAFDLTVTSLFCPISTGGAIVAYPGVEGEPAILDVLRDGRADVIKLTPSHLALMTGAGRVPCRLRVLIVGGENFETSLARQVHDLCGGRVAIYNEYGPTETTVGCMVHRFDPARDRRRSVPIGVPAANTYIHVLDAGLQPVAVDGVGELYIGGAGLAEGYLGAPELTAALFIPDPFRPDARVYKSGDLARRLPDDTLEFLGRFDDQAKIRGQRIDLAEVRASLNRHPGIRECIVRCLTSDDGRAVVVAYFVGMPIGPDELRSFAKDRLIPAAVPRSFIRINQIPLTASGKVDFNALPGVRLVEGSPEPCEAFATATERDLAAIWRRVLRGARVDRTSNFFDVGGDSLMAVSLFAEIERTMGVRLPPSVLFPETTLDRLAASIESQRHASRSPLVPIKPAGTRRPLFLVHGIGGEVLNYEPLARHLHPDQPVFGLRGDQSDLVPGEALRIEDMAARYVDAIRQRQPQGPYLIGGYSAGGLLAFEMARQIQAAGETVGPRHRRR